MQVKELKKKLASSNSLGKTSSMSNVSEKEYWMRDTHFTPPQGVTSKTPANMYGVQAPENIMSKLLRASFDNRENQADEEYGEACQFGWIKKGDKYYNLYTKEFKDDHLCC
ncbi:hypothetical protein MAM1_0035c02633 [Mucor ambiguus]|uniref:Uncharacterized protein n=1 Tax=Mucor ambiguus TaxID=91626 RepID=A0A0C9MJ86_9FUNG|nr:hypothetical protein MAM1_0035c02633 [Mucor ambiguus]